MENNLPKWQSAAKRERNLQLPVTFDLFIPTQFCTVRPGTYIYQGCWHLAFILQSPLTIWLEISMEGHKNHFWQSGSQYSRAGCSCLPRVWLPKGVHFPLIVVTLISRLGGRKKTTNVTKIWLKELWRYEMAVSWENRPMWTVNTVIKKHYIIVLSCIYTFYVVVFFFTYAPWQNLRMKPLLMIQNNRPHNYNYTVLFHHTDHYWHWICWRMSTYGTLNCYFYSIEVQVKQEQGQPRHEKKRKKTHFCFCTVLE